MLTDKLLALLIRSFNAFIVAYCCVSFPVGDTSLTGLIEVLVCLHLSWQVKPLGFFFLNIANLSRILRVLSKILYKTRVHGIL